MKKILLVISTMIISLMIFSGCESLGSASNGTITVEGKIIDFKPVLSDNMNIVYLIFDNGEVYCVGLTHFRLNTTVRLVLEKETGYGTRGGTFYIVKEYYESAVSG